MIRADSASAEAIDLDHESGPKRRSKNESCRLSRFAEEPWRSLVCQDREIRRVALAR